MLAYNLFVPPGLDPARRYPLVNFMHDASLTGKPVAMTLAQALANEFPLERDRIRPRQPRDAGRGRAGLMPGTVVPEGESLEGAAAHMSSWVIAHDIAGPREWLFAQRKG